MKGADPELNTKDYQRLELKTTPQSGGQMREKKPLHFFMHACNLSELNLKSIGNLNRQGLTN